ncbi:MAG: cytochrome c biogenesis CcdA family protein [Anaerolineales bacterium]
MSAQRVFADTEKSPLPQLTPIGPGLPEADTTEVEGAVHALYFYANDCPHCIAVLEEVILPMQEKYGGLLDIRILEIGNPDYYEAMLLIEACCEIPASQRSIPSLVIDGQMLIGETEIREKFPDLVSEGIEQGGIPFPDIEGLDPDVLISVDPRPAEEADELCNTDESCVVAAPLYAAYFYQTGCKECSRVEADLNYLKTRYPQLQVVEFNIYDHADLANWMVAQIGLEEDFQSPALFIGDQVLMGDEIVPDNIIPILEQYQDSGTEPFWLSYSSEEGRQSIIDRFKDMGWLAVLVAGLIDGINPCAFATLIFFVSYLTLSGRRGKEVLLVGGGFTLGVFLAYLAVGMGLYQVLELIGSTLNVIGQIVYIITGIFCIVLAVFSFIDYRKAREGEIHDMLLTLPKPLRKRINATIRKGRSTSNYIFGAFIAGVLISFLELACTGQVYLPTIIFVSSIPELQLQAYLYLVLYNLLFILPLIVIFILVYYGTTSTDLTRFLQERAATVKLAMGLVFIILGGWLLISLVV